MAFCRPAQLYCFLWVVCTLCLWYAPTVYMVVFIETLIKEAPMSKQPTLECLRAQSIFAGVTDRLSYLYDRWQDEKEYEDFADYIEQMKKLAPEGTRFIKGRQSPFGFDLQIGPEVWRFIATARAMKLQDMTVREIKKPVAA